MCKLFIQMSVYYYACTCTFYYDFFIPLCYTGAMCKDMKCLLQCFTRDKEYKLLSSCDTFRYLSSYTAIEAPERCVFGQLINIGAVLCKSTASQKKPEIFISQAMLILSVPTLKVYKDQGK